MTLEQLFDRPRTRNIFLTGVGVFVFLLFCVRYFVLPEFDAKLTQGGVFVFAKILEDVSTTIFVTIFITAFLWWIIPKRVRNAGIEVIEPRELKRCFSEALSSSNDWRFIGGCGRYFRSEVLGKMVERAREESRSKSVAAVILNPENDSLCAAHARFRSGTGRGAKDGFWSKSRVKQELLTTILITKKMRHAEGLLDARIFVSDHFGGFRIDISQSCAIETREDPTAPALRSDQSSYYYGALDDEFRLLRDQAREIVGGEEACSQIVDLPTLKHAISELKLNKIELSDADLLEVIKFVEVPKNPFGPN